MVVAEIVQLLGNKGDRIFPTVADGSAIEKGAVVVLTDPFTAITHAAVDTPVLGICGAEKVASDGATKVAVITNAIVKMTVGAGGSTTIGDTVSCDADLNEVDLATTLDDEKGWTIGTALEDGAAGETVLIKLKC